MRIRYFPHHMVRILVVCRLLRHLRYPKSCHTLCHIFHQDTPPLCLVWDHSLWIHPCNMCHHTKWCHEHIHNLHQHWVWLLHRYISLKSIYFLISCKKKKILNLHWHFVKAVVFEWHPVCFWQLESESSTPEHSYEVGNNAKSVPMDRGDIASPSAPVHV